MSALETRNDAAPRRTPLPAWLRGYVERRDRGRCARCGLDTRDLMQIFHRIADHARDFGLHGITAARAVGAALGYTDWPVRALHEIHHIVPVAVLLERGESEHRAANLETLCRPCHAAADAHGADGEAAALAAAKAERLERGDARLRAALEEKRDEPHPA